MADYNSLMSAVVEIHEGGYDKFVVLPVSDAQAEEYTDTDSVGKNWGDNMAMSTNELRDVIISFLNEEVDGIKDGVSLDYVRGEIYAVSYMLEMFNLPKLADIIERHYSAKLYKIIKEGSDLDEYEET